ncbi:MAG TPA: hypothetical protein VMM18_06125 [Gemmatimonadaceae bacterium]|nr:hypothetical protein [Gemmatimonadaceae bacterium]
MDRRRGRTPALLAAAALVAVVAPALEAQAWNYPAFQTPRTVVREFNVAIADADRSGTSLVFQWREGSGVRSQFSFDVGFADPDPGDTRFLFGGQYAYQMARASADMPLDFLLTAGFNAAVGETPNFFRIPIGVVLGHRFPLEGQLSLTPFLHPKLMVEFCDGCFGADDDSDIGIGFDVGVNFEFTRQLAMRFALVLGGTDLFDGDNGFGFSLAWTPAAAVRR